jgi:lysophospholipase L1-like esterase
MAPLSVRRKLLYAAIALVWFFLLFEATLWLIGFEYRPGSVQLEVDGRPARERLRRSSAAGWELEPRRGNVNAEGFIGPSIPRARTAGTLRLAAVGDSCTQFSNPPYMEIVRDQLAKRLDRSVESLNAGVSGYSSHQGVIRFRQDVLAYKPDVVVIYFGWNDHWCSANATDAGRQVILHRLATQAVWQLDRSKTVQAGLYLVDALAPEPIPVFRVPLDDYRRNLETMIELARSIDATPILVTALSDITESTRWSQFVHLPATLETRYRSPKAIHDAYIDATRAVARDQQTLIVDPARDLVSLPDLIQPDHIHPTDLGNRRIADLLTDILVDHIHNPHP